MANVSVEFASEGGASVVNFGQALLLGGDDEEELDDDDEPPFDGFEDLSDDGGDVI